MADKVKVRFDAEADYLEVRFSDAAGHMEETKRDAVMGGYVPPIVETSGDALVV